MSERVQATVRLYERLVAIKWPDGNLRRRLTLAKRIVSRLEAMSPDETTAYYMAIGHVRDAEIAQRPASTEDELEPLEEGEIEWPA